MAIKIGYTPWAEKTLNTVHSTTNFHGWLNQTAFPIEKVDSWDNATQNYMKCPALLAYINNLWAIKSPIDIKLQWDRTNKVLSSNITADAHDSYVRVHWGDFDPETQRPIVALGGAYLFVADQPTFIEFLPPFNHIDNGWRLMPGSFNIHTWQRPVVITFEMFEDEIEIKRGQPLAYVKFRTENLQDSFKLIELPRTQELEDAVKSCLSVKFYQPNLSWKIHNTAKKIKHKWFPKTWLKK